MVDILPLIQKLIEGAPWLATILMVVGALRLVIKPLVSIWKSVAESTPTKVDDELVAKVEASGWYKAVIFVVDWLSSIKLPGSK